VSLANHEPTKQEGMTTMTGSAITKYECTKGSAKPFLERMEASTAKGCEDREQLRFQLKALTISLSLTVFGFVIGRENQSAWVLLLVPLFCLFMHVLDTLLADLSDRQMKHRNRLNSYLLKFDTLDDAGIESALEKGFEGNMPPDWGKKVWLFFFPPLSDFLWHWGLFFGTLFLYFIIRNGK